MTRLVQFRRKKGGVPPTLVGSLATKAVTNSSTATAAANFPTNTATGDLVVAIVSWRRGTSAVISASGTGWTLLDSQVSGSSNRVSVFWKLKLANETTMSFTMPTAAASTVIIDAFSFRGFDVAAPVGAPSILNDTTSATTIPVPGKSVPIAAAVIAYGFYVATASSRTVTWGAPYVETSDNVSGTTGAYIGTSTAYEDAEPTGAAPTATATISITQASRIGYLIPINPA